MSRMSKDDVIAALNIFIVELFDSVPVDEKGAELDWVTQQRYKFIRLHDKLDISRID